MAFIGRGINTVRTVGNQEMTGRLTIKKYDNQMSCLTTALNQNPSDVIYTDNYNVSSTDGLSSVHFCTSNYPSNEIRGRIVIHKYMNNRDYFAEIGVSLDSNGKSFAYAPNSNQSSSIVTTAGIGSNYVLLGNGLRIQWGTLALTNGQATVNLPIPFATTGYQVACTCANRSGFTPSCITKTTTYIQLDSCYYNGSRAGSEQIQWIAIGY